MQRRLLGDDREAEAGAVGAGVRAAGERLEQALALRGGDAGTVVLDAHDEPAVVAGEADGHAAAALAAVQRGVVEQVVDDQAQPALPAVDPALLDVARQLVADAGVALARAVDGGVEDVAELDRLARQALGGLAARERLQALEQVHHAVLLGGHVGHQRLALLGGQPGVAGERVEVGAHRGQRRAQLVAGVGGEAPGRLERALGGGGRGAEAREHLVERAGELAHLLRAVVGQRRREVLRAADAGGARAQARERAHARAW